MIIFAQSKRTSDSQRLYSLMQKQADVAQRFHFQQEVIITIIIIIIIIDSAFHPTTKSSAKYGAVGCMIAR